jgi:hypothetical protein
VSLLSSASFTLKFFKFKIENKFEEKAINNYCKIKSYQPILMARAHKRERLMRAESYGHGHALARKLAAAVCFTLLWWLGDGGCLVDWPF